MESKVNSKNHVVLHGWFITELKLKGNELLVYAIIYGFCQDGENKFEGGLKYLQEWTCSSKNTVLKSLRTLEEKSLVRKEEETKNGIKFCKYSTIEPVVQNLNHGCENETSGAKTEHNNIYIINNIINHLNIILGSKFKPGVQKTQDLITARLKEGFTEEDFYTVIDKKYAEWNGTDFAKYLRPSTLFGTKFEGYLNQVDGAAGAKGKNTTKKWSADDLPEGFIVGG